MVVPDNVLFDDGRGKALRQRLMNWCDLHTILRLPTGIFYAQGVKTNVLFFTRAEEEAPATDATKAVWIYDMRSGAPAYGKTNPLKRVRLRRFRARLRRRSARPCASGRTRARTGRFRRFTRDGDRRARRQSRHHLAEGHQRRRRGRARYARGDRRGDRGASRERAGGGAGVAGGVEAGYAGAGGGGRVSVSPLGWATSNLDEIGEIFCGQSVSEAEVNRVERGALYVTGPEQWNGRHIERNKWTEAPKRLVPEGCIFITVKGAGVSKTFPGAAAAIGRDIYAYKPSSNVDAEFVHRAIRYRIAGLIAEARGDIPGLSRGHLAGHTVPLPPLAEQRRIVTKLDALTARLARARAELERF